MTISGYNCKRVSSVRFYITWHKALVSGKNQRLIVIEVLRVIEVARETLSYVKHYEAGNKKS